MNVQTGFDRLLVDWLEDDGPQEVPRGLVDEAIAEARTTRQSRLPWSLADVGFSTRLYLALEPMPRAFAYTALLLLLLAALAGAALVAASRQHRLPPPIGPAANGLVVDDSGGHIYTMGADGSGRIAITPSTETDSDPVWSTDGTRLAFITWSLPLGTTLDSMLSNGKPVLGSIVVTAPDGSHRQVILGGTQLHAWWPAWSHDSRRLAFTADVGGTSVVYVFDVDGKRLARISDADTPAWSPDDRSLAFRRPDDGVYIAPSDGSSPPRRVSGVSGVNEAFMEPRWSPDGRSIVYTAGADLAHSIWIVSATGGDDRKIASSSFDEWSPTWSPGGSSIAFTRALPSGQGMQHYQWQLVTASADGRGDETVYTTPPVDSMVLGWSPDGRYLLGVEKDPLGNSIGRIVVLDVATGAHTRIPGSATPDWQRLAP